VLEIHWDSHGTSIVSCSADKTVGLWDAKKGTRTRRLTSHTGIVNSCTFASDSPEMFVSGSDDCSVLVWDVRDRNPVHSIFHDYQVYTIHDANNRPSINNLWQITSVCVSSDGNYVYSGGIDNIIR
jgi:Prp8 binding protein